MILREIEYLNTVLMIASSWWGRGRSAARAGADPGSLRGEQGSAVRGWIFLILRALVLFLYWHNVLMCKRIVYCFTISLKINVLQRFNLRIWRGMEELLGVLESHRREISRVLESRSRFCEFWNTFWPFGSWWASRAILSALVLCFILFWYNLLMS